MNKQLLHVAYARGIKWLQVGDEKRCAKKIARVEVEAVKIEVKIVVRVEVGAVKIVVRVKAKVVAKPEIKVEVRTVATVAIDMLLERKDRKKESVPIKEENSSKS